MSQWRIKQISDLTGVSVRMLHHYDKIGLLTPSMRSDNGYRWYSESDLAMLQQIIALKFFGFNLDAIKTMVQRKSDIHHSLHEQQQMLQGQVESLRSALGALDEVLEKSKKLPSLDWKHLVTLIERYRMAEEIKNTWHGKMYETLDEQEQAAYMMFRKKYLPQVKAYEAALEYINNTDDLGDPAGPEGERIVKAFDEYMKLSREFGQKYAQDHPSEQKTPEQIMKRGNAFLANNPMFASPQKGAWYVQALMVYRSKAFEHLFDELMQHIDAESTGPMGEKIAQKWRDLIEDNIMGQPKDYALGMMIWNNLTQARAKFDSKPIDTPKFVTNMKAVMWLMNALKDH